MSARRSEGKPHLQILACKHCLHMMTWTLALMKAEMVDWPPGTQRTPIHQRLNMVEW